VQRPARIGAVKQDDVNPSFAPACNDMRRQNHRCRHRGRASPRRFHARIVAEAVPKPQAVFCGQRGFRRFHSEDGLGFNQLPFPLFFHAAGEIALALPAHPATL